MAQSQKEKILTSLTGEFLVASKLCQMGYFASLTLKNYPQTDIFVMGRNGRTIPIQVKTTRESNAKNHLMYVPVNIENVINPFVIVWIKKDETIDIFIIPAKDIARISKKEGEDYITKNLHVSKEQPSMIKMDSLQPYKDR